NMSYIAKKSVLSRTKRFLLSRELETLKVIKRLLAVLTFELGFTGRGTKLANQLGVFGAAVRATYQAFATQQNSFVGGWVQRRRNAVVFQCFSPGFSNHIGGPSRCEYLFYTSRNPFFGESHND